MNNPELEERIKNCKTLSELNNLSREIKEFFDNLNNFVNEKRIELIKKEKKPFFDRKKAFRDLNNLMKN